MRLDPKYFNLFIAICGVATLGVIFYGSIRYHQNQESTLRANLEITNLSDVEFPAIEGGDKVDISDFSGEVLVIDFWATWSGKSLQTHQLLFEMQKSYPELAILSAFVRDDRGLVQEYIDRTSYDFTFVEGTDFYHDLKVPGIPSHILVDRQGRYQDFQVGEDEEALRRKIEELIGDE